jgi:hypothetical protein
MKFTVTSQSGLSNEELPALIRVRLAMSKLYNSWSLFIIALLIYLAMAVYAINTDPIESQRAPNINSSDQGLKSTGNN